MLERVLSQKIVKRLCDHGIVDSAESNAYVYAYELLISSVISVLIVFILSYICGNVWYSVFFLVGFIPLRIYIGGYHASSHFNCYLAFSSAFLASVILSCRIKATYRFRLITTFILFTIAFLCAPIEAENKHLTVEKRKKYRFIGICLAGFDVILAAINIVPYLKFATVYYFSKWAVVVFALIPCFTRKIRK